MSLDARQEGTATADFADEGVEMICQGCGRRTKGGKEMCHSCADDDDYDEWGQGWQRRTYQHQYGDAQRERMENHAARIRMEEAAMKAKGLDPNKDSGL